MSVTSTLPKDLLQIADLDADGLRSLLDLAAAMKAEPYGWTGALTGRSVAAMFDKPSTRTRVSFEAACQRLGMLPMMLRPDELQLGRGEPEEDTARVLSRYASAIFVRTYTDYTLEVLAQHASVPVINALTDRHHPCQALADLLTLRERFGTLAGLRVAYIGDGNNVAHSLIQAAALAGVEVRVACPRGYEPNHLIVEAARAVGGAIKVTSEPAEAALDAHAVYTDVWVSMGDEKWAGDRRRDLQRYHVDSWLMQVADQDAVFMHCLPAHRGQEVTGEVIDGPQSVVWDQAGNRLPTEQAVLHALITQNEAA